MHFQDRDHSFLVCGPAQITYLKAFVFQLSCLIKTVLEKAVAIKWLCKQKDKHSRTVFTGISAALD